MGKTIANKHLEKLTSTCRRHVHMLEIIIPQVERGEGINMTEQNRRNIQPCSNFGGKTNSRDKH